jgi:hypothetical protein
MANSGGFERHFVSLLLCKGISIMEDFEEAALIYCGFDCDRCMKYECANPENYQVTAREAKNKGWFLERKGEGWLTLCPSCKINFKELL